MRLILGHLANYLKAKMGVLWLLSRSYGFLASQLVSPVSWGEARTPTQTPDKNKKTLTDRKQPLDHLLKDLSFVDWGKARTPTYNLDNRRYALDHLWQSLKWCRFIRFPIIVDSSCKRKDAAKEGRYALRLAMICLCFDWAVRQAQAAPLQPASTLSASTEQQSSLLPSLAAPLPEELALPKLDRLDQLKQQNQLNQLEQQAYQQITQEAAPLSPQQIKALRRLVDAAERAAAAPPRFTPKPVSSTVTVSLMPGETPPVVRLFANYVTNLLFIDRLGNPLNVTAVDSGGAATFNLSWSQNPAQASNLIKLSPRSTYAQGNLSVSLQQVPTPVSLTLISGQREVDYRVDVRVKGVGMASQSESTLSALDAMPGGLGLLAGIAPDGAQSLVSSQAEVQAWAYRNRFYLRTRYTLLSPAYLGMQQSADGTRVYEILPTSVLLVFAGEHAVPVQLESLRNP